MKKYLLSMPKLRMVFITAFVLICGVLFAQTDGGAAAAAAADPGGSILPFTLPEWVDRAMIIFVAVMPFIQFLLKAIPTEKSIRIQGFLGKLLDWATFFVNDQKKGGGKHK